MRNITATFLMASAISIAAMACTSAPAADPTPTPYPPTAEPTAIKTATPIATVLPTLTTAPAVAPTAVDPNPVTQADEPQPVAPMNRAGLEPPPPPPPPTRDVPLPTRPVTPPQNSFISAISDDERTCLGANIETDADLIEAVTGDFPTPVKKTMKCLTDENQFQLYMLTAGGAEELSVETHRCIWSAMLPLIDVTPADEADPETKMELFAKMMMLIVTVPIYCVATEQPDLPPIDEQPGHEAADQFMCMIENAGGIEQWTRLLFDSDPDRFEQIMNQAETECAPAVPQSAP